MSGASPLNGAVIAVQTHQQDSPACNGRACTLHHCVVCRWMQHGRGGCASRHLSSSACLRQPQQGPRGGWHRLVRWLQQSCNVAAHLPPSLQHAAHITQHTAHSTQHTAHSTQQAAHSRRHTAGGTPHSRAQHQAPPRHVQLLVFVQLPGDPAGHRLADLPAAAAAAGHCCC
jgi:hypothetical protein